MSEPRVYRVTLWLCELCLTGKGGECHTPGCALWLNRAPDLSLADHPMVERILGWKRKRCKVCGAGRYHKRATRYDVCDRCDTSTRIVRELGK